MKVLRKIHPKELDVNVIELIGDQWMLITAGDMTGYNTMTASWGTMGELWNKPVAFIFVRPQRYTHQFVEQHDTFTLSFFDPAYRPALTLCGNTSGRDTDKAAKTGLTPYSTEKGSVAFKEAKMVLECKKIYRAPFEKSNFLDMKIPDKLYPEEDFHTMYVGEIVNVWIKE